MNKKPLPLDDLEHIIELAKDPLEKLKNAHVFITGGTGFIGTWLVESLLFANKKLQLNMKIYVLSRTEHLHPEVEFIVGDVRDFVFPEKKFTHIIHAGTPSSALTHQGRPEEIQDIIVRGMKRILAFADYCGASTLLFLSSGAVYGKHSAPVDENTPINPDPCSDYAMGKAQAEKLCFEHTSKLEIKIARCFAFVGPHLPLDQHYAIGNFIRDALKGGPIVVKNPASVYRSYQYAADMVIWLLHILAKGRSKYPYNVGSSESISLFEFAKKISLLTNSEIVVHENYDSNKLANFYAPCVKRSLNEYGFHQRYSLNDAIIKTISWESL